MPCVVALRVGTILRRIELHGHNDLSARFGHVEPYASAGGFVLGIVAPEMSVACNILSLNPLLEFALPEGNLIHEENRRGPWSFLCVIPGSPEQARAKVQSVGPRADATCEARNSQQF